MLGKAWAQLQVSPLPGATSWTPMLDVVRLGPEDDATAVTAAQFSAVAERPVAAGQWVPGDRTSRSS